MYVHISPHIVFLPCRPKGENVDVKGLNEDAVGAQQCYVVFDVLMINDSNLANQPLAERVKQLKKLATYIANQATTYVRS